MLWQITQSFLKSTLIARGGLKKTLGVILVEGDHPSNRDKEKMEAFSVTWFLFLESLSILVGLGLPGPFSWRTINVWEQ